jgi:hypothetical protein
MNDILIAIACFTPTAVVCFMITNHMKKDYSARFPGEYDSTPIRAHTDEGAKRIAKRLMRKRGHDSFKLRRC